MRVIVSLLFPVSFFLAIRNWRALGIGRSCVWLGEIVGGVAQKGGFAGIFGEGVGGFSFGAAELLSQQKADPIRQTAEAILFGEFLGALD